MGEMEGKMEKWEIERVKGVFNQQKVDKEVERMRREIMKY